MTQQRSLLQAALNSTFEAMVIYKVHRDDNGNPIDFEWYDANEDAIKRLPKGIGDPKGRTIRDFMPKLIDSDIFRDFLLVAGGSDSASGVFDSFIGGEDYNADYRCRLFTLPSGEDGLLVAFRNWDEIEEIRTSLKAGDDFRQAILDTIDVAIVLADQRGDILMVNSTLETILGYSESEAMGLNVRTLCPPEIEVEHDSYLTNYLQTGNAKIIGIGREVEARTKDGRRIPVLLQISTVEHEGETRFVGFITDLSDRRQLEEQLRRSQRLEALGALAGGIAHDFNNTIAPILGQSEIMLRMTDVDERIRSRVELLKASAQRASDLVKRILAFSRPSSGDFEAVDVVDTVTETVELLKEVLPKTVTMTVDAESEMPTVMAIPAEIHQVVLNLVTNAHQAIQGGHGFIKCSVRRGELRAAGVEMRQSSTRPTKKEAVVLRVRDNGIGIEQKMVQRIFDPFFTTKQADKGTGLGLATVHRIVIALGGTIDVESEVGVGTTFEIRLPAHESNHLTTKTAKSSRSSTGKSKVRVMYIDDEVPLTQMTNDMLTMLGFEPTVYNDPAKALSAIIDAPGFFDLIITDQTMPGMFGSDLANEVAQLSPAPPVAICTGHTHDPKVLGLAPNTIVGVLEKPVGMDELAKFIASVTDR